MHVIDPELSSLIPLRRTPRRARNLHAVPTRFRAIEAVSEGATRAWLSDSVAQWRFEPGRLGGAPVDVLVTICSTSGFGER